MADSKAKHQQVRDTLLAAIRAGEYEPGSKLPSERELAARFGVSYMTARRAVTELVEAELIERRPNQGSFVRENSQKRLAATTIHLICMVGDSSTNKQFLRFGARAIEEMGWRPNILRVAADHVIGAERALESGDGALFFVSNGILRGPLGVALEKARGHAVLIGNRLDSGGVPSVLADDAHAIRLAVQHLHEAGHRAIGIVSNDPDHPVDRVQIAAWQACCNYDVAQVEKLVITIGTPAYESVMRHTYDAVLRFLNTPPAEATALICIGDVMAMAVLAACRDAGRPVPEKMSLVNSGDSSLMEFAHPPITCVDVDMEGHIAQAMQILQAAQQNLLASPRVLRLIQPHLVARSSVAPPAS